MATNLSDFWAKDIGPPSSPDLNPLDFSIWGVLEDKTCKTPHPSVEALKASTVKSWRTLCKEYIVRTCRSFWTQRKKVVEAEGCIFEK